MLWSKSLIIMAIVLVIGFLCGRVMMPYFRKLKTGKFDLYIGSRFEADGSEPLFGGAVMLLPLLVGTALAMGTVNVQNDGLGENIGAEYLSVSIFAVFLMLLGAVEDYLKDVRKANVGLKYGTKILAEFILCLAFLLSLKAFCHDGTTEILLPFRLGYINFGWTYYPLLALGMTITINAVKVHDCFGRNTKSSVGGLCTLSVMIYSLFFAAYGAVAGNDYLNVFAYVFSAVCGGFLIWNISPAKIHLGQSGSLLLGGIAAGLAVVSKLHICVLLAGISFFIDGFCSLLEFIVYKKSKKLIFKGESLHGHFLAKGYSDYKIMIIFSGLTIIGGAAGVAFAVYSTKLM
ncbi:MAG: hypothetical protein ACI4RC_04780 [Oscillospiraceae bacterium]